MSAAPGSRSARSDIAIEVEGLTKSFDGRTVVRNLTMQVKRGLIYGFLGPNGSGKTTTIRMLCGLLTPDSGRGTCLGFDIRTEAEKIKRHVGYMTQRFSLYQDLSVRENLEFVARIYGIANPRAAARGAIERLGLARPRGADRRRSCRAAGSSGSRSAPARCRTRSSCCSTSRPPASIRRRGASSGTRSTRSPAEGLTVLVSTHYMDEAERCHEIAYIAYGELLAHGTVEEVIAKSHLATYTVSGDDLRAARRRARASRRRRHGGAVRRQPARVGPRRGGARGGDRAVSRRRRRCTGSKSEPRSRTCSSS